MIVLVLLGAQLVVIGVMCWASRRNRQWALDAAAAAADARTHADRSQASANTAADHADRASGFRRVRHGAR